MTIESLKENLNFGISLPICEVLEWKIAIEYQVLEGK